MSIVLKTDYFQLGFVYKANWNFITYTQTQIQKFYCSFDEKGIVRVSFFPFLRLPHTKPRLKRVNYKGTLQTFD